MKKLWSVLVLLLIAAGLLACKPDGDVESVICYDIQMQADFQTGVLTASQEVLYTNATGDTLSELVFNLYANAFRQGAQYPAVGEAHKAQVYYAGKSFGRIDIESVTVNQSASEYAVGGVDENLLTIQLPAPLGYGEKLAVNIEYTVTLPKANARMGLTQTGANIANFYPQLAVYESGEFVKEPYFDIGDPFYSDIADYFVRVSFAEGGVLASTGKVTDSYLQQGRQFLEIEAQKVRDFAMCYLADGKSIAERSDGTDIVYYYTSDSDAQSALDTAVCALSYFNGAFGKYPYATYSVVSTPFAQGGMEYPNLVFVNSALSGQTKTDTIVHETAHQWWYGAVGTNGVQNAWLDEGLAEFSTAMYLKAKGSGALFHNYVKYAQQNYISTKTALEKAGKTHEGKMVKSLADFQSEGEYVATAYDRSLMMFMNMYHLIGEKAMYKSLSRFYNNNKYKNAGEAELLACFKNDQQRIFKMWLDGKAHISSGG